MKLIVLILITFLTKIDALFENDSIEKWLKNGNEDLTRNDIKPIDLEDVIKVSEVVRSMMMTKSSGEIKGNNSICACQKYNCGCCVHLEWDTVNLNDTICTNFTYLPDQYGVSLTISLDGKVIIRKTISVKNPPPLCVGVPYLKKFASICVQFKDLDYSNRTLSGCVFVLARLEGFEVEKVKLGCFKLPPSANETMAIGTGENLEYPYSIGENKMKDSNIILKSLN